MVPHITLEQWRTLLAVVDAGGYAQAAELLHKSQSAVTYAVQKIESLLGVKAFEIQGRKAILTPTGQMLYRRALALVGEANDLEQAAHTLSAGWEVEIHIAAEILFPSRLLLTCLERFSQESPGTRLELIESVLGGTSDALLKGEADLVISPQLPPGFLGDPLMRISLRAVAHADHPLLFSYQTFVNYANDLILKPKQSQVLVKQEANAKTPGQEQTVPATEPKTKKSHELPGFKFDPIAKKEDLI